MILCHSRKTGKPEIHACRVANKVALLRAIKTGIVGDTQNLRKDGFFALELAPEGHAGPPTRPDLPFARLLAALRLRPRRALSSAEARQASCQSLQAATETRQQKLSTKAHFSNFDRTTT
jgi:hypothetical protein